MLKSKVSVRGQTVIPQEIRERLGIEPNSEIAWWIEGGTVTVVPIPEDPVEASIGMFAGRGYTLDDFLKEREAERELDRQRDKRLEQQVVKTTGRKRT